MIGTSCVPYTKTQNNVGIVNLVLIDIQSYHVVRVDVIADEQ